AGLQGGFDFTLAENAKSGVRASVYYMNNLDEDFIMTGVDGTGGSTSGGGNIAEVLTGDPHGGDLQVVAGQGYATLQDFPLTVFGGYSVNLSAEAPDTLDVSEEKTAYNFGIEGGDKKKYAHLGLAYYYIEANAFPSQFIDSDLFDGRTNRKGIMVYGARQLLEGTDFNIKVYASDAIEANLPVYEESVEGSNRIRVQIDLVYKF
ncbi:MAG: putative porin, partial [Candidatus Latescibacterota bacterium]